MKIVFLTGLLITALFSFAQPRVDDIINAKEVERIERVLASDAMRGRKAGSPDINEAAEFIAEEFKKIGLQPLQGNSFLQEFIMIRPKLIKVKAELDGQEVSAQNIIVNTFDKELKIDQKSGYNIEYVKAGESLGARVSEILKAKKNMIVFVDPGFSANFPRLAAFSGQGFATEKDRNTIVYILGNYEPKEFSIKAENSLEESNYSNVVGVLPGKSKKDEYVVFSAHYDHLGIGKPVNSDSIYNGANDDASGTTAVVMLAKYFKALANNERTIVFAAFTAEELGGYGSRYFSKQFDPPKVIAMFNIEMIGTESKWGKNSAYITGFEKSDMGSILQKNLEGTGFIFYADPYTEQQLFYRSDNATLARLGVPAHTISTSKMDSEPNYHKVSDEIGTLDLQNMAMIIKSIALSSRTIVGGKDTPTRVRVEELR